MSTKDTLWYCRWWRGLIKSPAADGNPPNINNAISYRAVPSDPIFSQTLQAALKKAEARMFVNISPLMHKIAADNSVVVPSPGSIIAANHSRDPDYFFNWIRDSANVMNAVVTLYEQESDENKAGFYLRAIDDYLNYTLHLDYALTPYGRGETRFNVDGRVDHSEWSRPQFDGPALRALTLMHFLAVDRLNDTARDAQPLSRTSLIRTIIKGDLDYLVDHWHEPCFDIWESYRGEYYATRLFALSAFDQSSEWCAIWHDIPRMEAYISAANAIRQHLDAYWRPEQGVLAYSLGPLTDVHGLPRTAPGQGIDAGVVMASVQANVPAGPHSLTDPRLMSTAAKLESIFASLYEINRDPSHGPGTAIGRHIGDGYYGGHPWFFITAGFAELYYKLAAALAKQTVLVVTRENQEFLKVIADRMRRIKPWELGENVMADAFDRRILISGLRQHGDDFIWMILSVLPEDGAMAEQFDKKTGRPRSATGLTWSYSSLITAALSRAGAVKAECCVD